MESEAWCRNMSKALITHSYFYQLDPKQWAFQQPYPPLGTLQAASVIRDAGIEVNFFDVALNNKPEEIGVPLNSYKPLYFIIYDDGFNYLTKMCLTVMREAAFKMSELAKKNGAIVIVSSSDSTDHYEKYFEHGVDYVIRGEGEETLRELLRALENKKTVDGILGIAYQTENKTIVNAARPVLRQLDNLPPPAWDLIDIEPYRKIWLDRHGYFSLNIATTRGCPYKCNWCAKPIYGNRYNSRSPKKVVDEIEYLLIKFKPTHFWMCDDIFGLKPGWIKEFKNEVEQRNLDFKYKIQSRVDLLLEEDTIDSLVESGIETIWVGAESGSQKILDAMDKGTQVEQIYSATRLLKSKGVKTAFFLQFGYPEETQHDIDLTLKMVLELMPDEIGISVSYPLPGTKFYENVKSQLSAKQNWVDSDELAMMFTNRYPTAFYKILQRYVHGRYRLKLAFLYFKGYLKKPFNQFPRIKKIIAVPYFLLLSLIYAIQLRKYQTHGN